MSQLNKALRKVKENCGCNDEVEPNSLMTFLVRRNAAEEEETGELNSAEEQIDSVSMDVPLLIRMFELMREEIKDDETIHEITQNLIKLAASGETLTMDNYNKIVGNTDREEREY